MSRGGDRETVWKEQRKQLTCNVRLCTVRSEADEAQ